MESEDDDVTIVRRSRKFSGRGSAGAVGGSLPVFDLLAAVGDESVDVDTVDGSTTDPVSFMRRFGGAETLWKATLAARREGREIVGDGVLRGRQKWRRNQHGIDFRFA